MVTYWPLDGKVLASEWVNSGPEMLKEELVILAQNKTNGWVYRQNCILSEVLRFWWTLTAGPLLSQPTL